MSTEGIGTYRNPLVHPVTGERIVFRRRARDTAGELLEVTLYSAPTGFVPSAHVHPSQEERLEISEAVQPTPQVIVVLSPPTVSPATAPPPTATPTPMGRGT